MKQAFSISCFKLALTKGKVDNSAGECLEPVYFVKDAQVVGAATKSEMLHGVWTQTHLQVIKKTPYSVTSEGLAVGGLG